MKLGGIKAALAAAFVAPVAAHAQEAAATVNTGDTGWILTASAFVLLMTLPGLGLFYGGLVRARNVLSVLMHCFAIACGVSLLWAIAGYSLVFDGTAPWLGGTNNLFLANLADVRSGLTLPENAFALFQMTFAAITPALIVGAFVERVRFGWVMGFSLLWTLLVYFPVAHWMWGGGWLAAQWGALDFAGGVVVHTTAGIAALVVVLLLGPRKGFNKTLMLPHSPALTMTGAGLLWVGWYGFNGGSALAANGAAAGAILNTHFAACAAALVWIVIEHWRIGKPTSVGIVTGAIAGLATVTPAAGYIGPMGAMLLGVAGGAICFFAVQIVKQKIAIDDSLDVFAVHGVGGMLGSLLMPVTMLPALGGGGFSASATFQTQLVAQALAVGVTILWTGAGTWVAARVMALFVPMRVSVEAEHDGLDLTSHGERGWEMD
ncbi:MAG: ammonium transporter [Sphingobium sp.]|jgi:Amt family ammonium transporter|nr:ammonium transporter [Sphingobium sp.]MCI1271564.1 ammonium transporter [Sphingobium sp.]MCI1756093.1 ammonium transporter [Sphingobium sp.]MCI2052670.1 ammonium transporter [Sphingobium sp.]